MRIFLALILLVNSYVAVGGATAPNEFAEIEALILQEPEVPSDTPENCAEQFKNSRSRGPAAAPQCQTPSQLMAANVNSRDFTRICRTIVENDEGCKKLKPEKRMSCNAKRENEILSTADLLNRAGQCIKGFAWDSMVDLAKFVLELIKMLVGAQVSTVTGMIRFLSDSSYREEMLSKAQAGSRLGMAFLRSAGQYFAREFPNNLKKHPFNPMMAVGETLFGPLVRFMTDAVQQIAAHYIPQYQCMNGTAKLYTICRVFGELIMPPMFVFSFLKYGVRGLQTLSRTQALKIGRVRGRFAEANEVRQAARTSAPPSRITVDQTTPPRPAPRTTTPPPAVRQRQAQITPTAAAHPPRPQPARPLSRPIQEHTADDLVELARSEQAATADLNRAEAARVQAMLEGTPSPAAASVDDIIEELVDTREYKAILEGLNGTEKTEAAHAIDALSKSGVSPGIVVGMFQKYGPQFRAEVARTPAGAENLWSKLARYVKREKQAGKSDEAIQRKVDDAFKCN